MAVTDRPELADLFDAWERNVHTGLHVCMLGEVTRYHARPPSVDIQPSPRPLLASGERYDRPKIFRVPIAQWSFGPIVLRAVPEVGDGCMCHVFDREIVTWLLGRGGTYNPDSRRTHNPNDIVAVPSMRTNRRQPSGTDKARTVYLGHESGKGTYLKLDVETGAVEVVASTSVKLGGELATLGVARVTDPVGIAPAAVSWFTTMAAFVAKIPIPLTPPELTALTAATTAVTTQLGVITSGSVKVKSE